LVPRVTLLTLLHNLRPVYGLRDIMGEAVMRLQKAGYRDYLLGNGRGELWSAKLMSCCHLGWKTREGYLRCHSQRCCQSKFTQIQVSLLKLWLMRTGRETLSDPASSKHSWAQQVLYVTLGF